MILVTGGAGFIGSVLVGHLNDRGRDDIILVDRMEDSSKWKNLMGLRFEEFIHADELFVHLDELNISGIFHMGACSATTETDVDFLMKNNVEYSQGLFEYATKNNVPIVYASSAATYGSGECGYDDSHQTISKLRPLNPYGFSKQYFDQWVLRGSDFPDIWYGVKFFNVFGPNEYHKGPMRSVVKQAHEQIKDSGKVRLFKSDHPDYEDGGQLRDFVYVNDVVKAMIDLVEIDQGQNNGIYNLGTGQARSFADLARATFLALGEKEKLEFFEMPDHLKGQYQYFTQAEMGKLKKALPDMEFMSLEDAVADYVNNYLEQDFPYYVAKD